MPRPMTLPPKSCSPDPFLYSIFEDDKYNSNDLGFLYSNNEITNGIVFRYLQFNEGKRFVDFSSEIEIEHQTLYTDQKFVDFHYQLEAKATLKNYTTISIRANFNPSEISNVSFK